MVFHSKFSLKTIIHSFNSKSLSSWQNLAISQKKSVFWSTLEAPSEKTVHFQELVMIFKVFVNNIVDIIYFDQNSTVSSEITVSDFINYQICDDQNTLSKADKCMQRANFQQRFFWSDFFCIVSTIVQCWWNKNSFYLFFAIKLKIIIFNLFIRFIKIKT